MFYCEIISGLWIGDIDIMLHKKFIKENNINIIINCTQQIAFPEVDVKKVRIPFSDRSTSTQPVNRFSAFQVLCPCLIAMSLPIEYNIFNILNY